MVTVTGLYTNISTDIHMIRETLGQRFKRGVSIQWTYGRICRMYTVEVINLQSKNRDKRYLSDGEVESAFPQLWKRLDNPGVYSAARLQKQHILITISVTWA